MKSGELAPCMFDGGKDMTLTMSMDSIHHWHSGRKICHSVTYPQILVHSTFSDKIMSVVWYERYKLYGATDESEFPYKLITLCNK